MTYDPAGLGARCAACILNVRRDGDPVGPETHVGVTVAVVGEGPGDDEIREGRPFVGRAGMELDHAFRLAGVQRTEMSLFHAFACRPVDGDYAAMERLRKQINKERAKSEQDPLLPPVDACRPRLLREVEGYQDIIPLGAKALAGVVGVTQSITAVRGGMLDGWLDDWQGATRFYAAEGPYAAASPTPAGRRVRILPTLHPNFVLHARRWTKVFRSDLNRAVRWFAGYADWQEPRITYRPTPDALHAFLRDNNALAYDVETDGIEPLTCQLRCIGIGTGDDIMLVPLLGIDGRTTFYTQQQEQEIRNVLRDWFGDTNALKIGHNAGYYDRMVIESHFGVTPRPLLDTILLHRAVESELPHNLGYVASIYAALSPAWKATRTATTAETDRDLHHYCGIDVAQNFRITPPLVEHVKLRAQERTVKIDHGLQEACVAMHRTGMFIDRTCRDQWNYQLTSNVEHYRARLQHIVGDSAHNPGSVNQVRDLLFDRWSLPVPDGSNGKPKLTKNGDPSTDDEAIRALRIHPATTGRALAYLDTLRRYRANQKLLGTYIKKLVPNSVTVAASTFDLSGLDDDDPLALSLDPYEEAERAAYQKRRDKERERGIIWPDGRIHPTYNVHATVVGRIAASNPNTLNQPSILRDMFAAAPGHILIGADKDQIHLRIAAARWGIAKYLEAFARKADPHATTAFMIFGERFKRAPGAPRGVWDGEYFIPDPTAHGAAAKWSKLAKNMRDLAKRVQYASLYKATVETVWRVITASEDSDGTLIYADRSLPDVRFMYDAWLRGVPEVPRGWEREVTFYRDNEFCVDPILGRRRDFLDSKDSKLNENEVINYPILAAEGSIMSIETIAVNNEFPSGYAGPGTGLINQNYDSMVLEVPLEQRDHAQQRLEALMTTTYAELPGVVFSAAAESGPNWKAA
jgi:uracil-DNA glycosylase family 4